MINNKWWKCTQFVFCLRLCVEPLWPYFMVPSSGYDSLICNFFSKYALLWWCALCAWAWCLLKYIIEGQHSSKGIMQVRDPGYSMCGKRMWELDFQNNMLILYTLQTSIFLCLCFYFEILEPKQWCSGRDSLYRTDIWQVCIDNTKVAGWSSICGGVSSRHKQHF